MAWWLRYLFSCAFYYSGALFLWRWVRRRLRGARIVVLAYHGVNDRPPYIEMFTPAHIFAEQMAFIARHYETWSLDRLSESFRSGKNPAGDVVLVTFDDGYHDNYAIAHPHALRHGVPMTIFLTTSCLDEQRPTFVAALIDAIDATRCAHVDLTGLGLGVIALGDFAARCAAISRIDGLAKPLSDARREELLREVRVALGFAPNGADIPSRTRMLNWDEVRAMASAGVTFGGHTLTHPVLRTLDDDSLRREITQCRTRMTAELGQGPRHFAYPYGGPAEVDARVVEMASSCGYESAVLLQEVPVDPARPYEIGRVMLTLDRTARPGGAFSRALFACELAGVFSMIRRFKTPATAD